MSNYLSGEILEDGGQVDRSTGTNTLGVLSGLKEPSDTADGELETGFAAPGGGLLSGAGS